MTGLFAAWFNVPFLLFMAGVGALFGALNGVVSGTIAGPGVSSRLDALLFWVLPLPINVDDLLPTAAVQIGGIVGGLLGMVHGGLTMVWETFAGFWQLLYEGDPTWPWAVAVGQVVTAVFVATLYSAYTVSSEAWRLRVAGVRRPSRREAEWLAPMVREAARRLGAQTWPTLRVDDSREPNATAGARHIVVNQGLLEFLRYDDEAVAGVIAHEVAHWRNGDPVAMAWGKGIALPLYLAYNLAYRIQQSVRWTPIQVLVWLVLWSVAVTMRGIVAPMHAAEWQRCEYRADADAKAAGYGDGLYRALSLLRRGFDGSRTGWDASILATHPHTELRLERLEQPGQHYPLVHGHSGALPVPPVRAARRGPDKD